MFLLGLKALATSVTVVAFVSAFALIVASGPDGGQELAYTTIEATSTPTAQRSPTVLPERSPTPAPIATPPRPIYDQRPPGLRPGEVLPTPLPASTPAPTKLRSSQILPSGMLEICESDAIVTVLTDRVTSVERVAPGTTATIGESVQERLPFPYPMQVPVYRDSSGNLRRGSTNCVVIPPGASLPP